MQGERKEREREREEKEYLKKLRHNCIVFKTRARTVITFIRVQLSVGAEMEAYGDQAAAANNQFICKFREEPGRKLCDRSPTCGTTGKVLIFSKYFSRFN